MRSGRVSSERDFAKSNDRETRIMTARVGLIIPSSNRMVEQEMIPAFPEGIRVHVTRLRMTGINRGSIEHLLPRLKEATRALVDSKCDVIVFHCTANSMQEGRRGEERIRTIML